MIVWCIYVFWEKRIVPDTTDRPLAYTEPNDPCEEVVDEDNLISKDSAQGHSWSLPPRALGRFLKFSFFWRESSGLELTPMTPAVV